ncbi:universal stress protein [Halorussus salinisoli]|uniref:universal stress protein n=1 Tax=Halorussus salinisoli TaxID=2558242 RepID=UPI0010C22DA3|nr:universal stress protein [Halorussus salinisoli]
MERALTVVESIDEDEELLRNAGELASNVDATLVILSILTEEEYENNAETLERIANRENTSYGNKTGLSIARKPAEEAGETVLQEIDVEYEAVGVVVDSDSKSTKIIEVAEDRECDHVFIRGKRRSPTGKALFGDTAQSVILNFDGMITLATE